MARVLMLYLASLMIRSLCIAAVAGVCTLWIRSVTVRHAIWVTVLITMLLMPVADAVLPSSWVPAPVERIAGEKLPLYQPVIVEPSVRSAIAPPVISRPTQRPINWWSVTAALYMLVGLTLFARLGLAWRKIGKLKRHSRPVNISIRDKVAASYGLRRRTPQLRQSDSVRVPITIGFLQPVVILPVDWDTWDDWKLHAVLAHEFAHVRRWDWTIAAVAAFNQCMFWLNPLSSFLKRHLSELAERACDDAALHLNNDAARYAEVLLQFAAAHSGYRFHTGGIAMAKMNMKARIERVLRVQRPTNGILKLAGWVLVVTLSIPVLYAAAAMHVASGAAPQQFAQLQSPTQNTVIIQEATPQEQSSEEISKRREAERQLSLIDRYIATIGQAQPIATLTAPATSETAAQSREFEKAGGAYQNTLLEQTQTNTTPPVTSTNSTPRLVSRVEPVYPPALRSAGVEGSVLLSVTIGPDGNVLDMKAMRATNPLMAAAAIEAVRQWVFQPTLVDGKEGSVITEISVDVKPTSSSDKPADISGDALLNLPDNKDDLLAYLTQLAQLRNPTSPTIQAPADPSPGFYVNGKVRRSGAFNLDRPMTVMQAIASAGGFTDFAKPSDIKIIRSSGTLTQTFQFNYLTFIDGTDSRQNIPLQNGDVIIVP